MKNSLHLGAKWLFRLRVYISFIIFLIFILFGSFGIVFDFGINLFLLLIIYLFIYGYFN